MIERIITFSGKDYDQEIIKYGFVVIRNGVLSVAIILMCGIIENKLVESLLYLFCNLIIYTKVGGYHAKTQIGCLMITVATWKVALIFSSICMDINIFLGVILGGVYIILVWKNAPVLHPNKARFGEAITKKQRIVAIVRLLIGYGLIIVFWSTHKQEYSGILMMGISEIIISMLIGKELYKRYEEKENG